MNGNLRVFSSLAAGVLFLASCNLPQAPTTDLNLVKTEVAQTIEAQLTQNFLLTPSATLTPPATQTPPPPTASPTEANSPTPTPICDLAQYVTDVSVPDGSPFLANQAFTKTWRLKNIGVCTWNSGYQVIFENGEAMSGPASQGLAGTVAPGQTVDLSVNLKAPNAVGAYRGYWKLRNPAGVIIPVVSGYQGNSFFVDIKTVPPEPTVTMTPLVLVPLIPIIPIKIHTPTPTLIKLNPFPIIIVTLKP